MGYRATVYGNLIDSSQYSPIKALLDSRKGRQEQCLSVAETITFTCSAVSGTESKHPGRVQVEILLQGKGGKLIRRGTVET